MDRTSPSHVPPTGTDPQSVLHFEVRRGRTASPERPVAVSRFLIGSDPECHLCLGSDELPPLHSIVLATSDGTWIEAIAETPPLKVNGVFVVEKQLAPGDTIEIGPFELVAAWHPPTAEVAEPTSLLERFLAADFTTPVDLDDLESVPASELVELLEQEEALLDEFMARRGLGADALLLAALERSCELAEHESAPALRAFPAPDAPESDSFPQPDIARQPELPTVTGHPGDLEQVVAHLTGIADELNGRADRLARRERAYSDAAAALLEAQQKLTEQMESILSRLAALETTQAPPTRHVA